MAVFFNGMGLCNLQLNDSCIVPSKFNARSNLGSAPNFWHTVFGQFLCHLHLAHSIRMGLIPVQGLHLQYEYSQEKSKDEKQEH